MSSFVVAIDQGSSSTKVLAFDRQGRQAYRSSRPLRVERPEPTHVEQDPVHVLQETRRALDEVIGSIYGDGNEVRALGLACQRSSFLFWNRETGNALTPMITWQDLRAKDLCAELSCHREMIYAKTGLPLTGHYGGPKFLWLLRNHPQISKWLRLPESVFSPWNSFLLWHLTEEKVCATDESIVGRSLLFNIHERQWDQELLDLFEMPQGLLPEVWVTARLYGHYRFKDQLIPITCSIGDHQGALLGLGGLEKGNCAINYGTSAGILTNIGPRAHIVKGLLTSAAYSTAIEVTYTVEGTVNAVGSLFEWFERERRISGAAKNWEEKMVPSSKGWFMVPGMYGIAAPYWKETVDTEFIGEGNLPEEEVLLRAGMESIAFLVADSLERIRMISGLHVNRIVAAGGAARPPLLQFQADVLGLPIELSSVADATALGCAFLAGLQADFWKNKKEIGDLICSDETFHPRILPREREILLVKWHNVLRGKGILH